MQDEDEPERALEPLRTRRFSSADPFRALFSVLLVMHPCNSRVALYIIKKSFIACLLCKFKENIWNVKTQADLYHTCSFLGLRTFKLSLSCRSISRLATNTSTNGEKRIRTRFSLTRKQYPFRESTLHATPYTLQRRRAEHQRFPAGAQLTLNNCRNTSTSCTDRRCITRHLPSFRRPLHFLSKTRCFSYLFYTKQCESLQ